MTQNPDSGCIVEMARECLGFRLRKLDRVVSGYYNEALKPLGIKISQMNILVIIAIMKQASPSDICNYARINISTLSRNIERMEAKGWVKYLPAEDGRSHYLSVTANGMKLLNSVYAAWKKAQQQVQSLLGKEMSRHLDLLSTKIMSA